MFAFIVMGSIGAIDSWISLAALHTSYFVWGERHSLSEARDTFAIVLANSTRTKRRNTFISFPILKASHNRGAVVNFSPFGLDQRGRDVLYSS